MDRLPVLLLVAACGGTSPAPTGGTTGPTGGAPSAAASDASAPAELTYQSGDVTIAGSYWAPSSQTGACVLFVHQLSSSRKEWMPVIERLRGRAHVYAIDMRGHGGSTGGPKGWEAFTKSDWEHVADDLGPALAQVTSRGGDARCVLVGSSIGASAVVRYAASRPETVRAMVLLSPGIAYRGVNIVDAARKVTAIPTLVVVSEEPGAADAAGALQHIWREAGKDIKLITRAGSTAHGMKIVADHDSIRDQIVGFIETQLRR